PPLRLHCVHESIKHAILPRSKSAYETVSIGHPLEGNLVGPLIDEDSFNNMQAALKKAREAGGTVTGGERVLTDKYPNAYYVTPAIVEFDEQNDVARSETIEIGRGHDCTLVKYRY